MTASFKPSQRAAVAAAIAPLSQGVGSISTAWVSMATFSAAMAVLNVGVLGTLATVDAKIQQATDSAGTGVKDITGRVITQLTKAGTDDNKQAVINIAADDLDVSNSFTHVRLTVTVAAAASLLSATLLGFDPRYGLASANDATTVDEIV